MATAWNPVDHIAEHHAGWEIQIRDVEGSFELFAVRAKLIILDTWAYRLQPRFLVAHAVAHLDLHLEVARPWSVAQEQEADWWADIWTKAGRRAFSAWE